MRWGAPSQSAASDFRREIKEKSDISENTNGYRSTGLFIDHFPQIRGAYNCQTNGNSKCRIPNVSTCRILKICTAVTLGRTRQRLINDVWIITDADDYAPLNKNMDQKKLSVL